VVKTSTEVKDAAQVINEMLKMFKNIENNSIKTQKELIKEARIQNAEIHENNELLRKQYEELRILNKKEIGQIIR